MGKLNFDLLLFFSKFVKRLTVSNNFKKMSENSELKITTITKEDFLDKIQAKKKIANSTIISKIVIDQNIELKNDLIFVNCIFNDELDIINNSKIDVTFIDCSFKKRLFLVGDNYKNVQLTRCSFELFIAFEKLFCINLTISNCNFNNKILTQLQDFNCKKFEFINNKSSKDFQFKPQKVEKIFLEGSESNYLVTFYGSSKITHTSIMLFNYSNNRTNFIISDFTTQNFRIFGDLNDTESNVSKLLQSEIDERAYHVLEEINTFPNIYYLTKIRNIE